MHVVSAPGRGRGMDRHAPDALRALADREPTVAIQQPANDLRLAAKDAGRCIPSAAAADFGLRSREWRSC